MAKGAGSNNSPNKMTEAYKALLEYTNDNPTIMHELWHFFTWYKFGDQMKVLGVKRYNEFKESLRFQRYKQQMNTQSSV